jgi:hypothetical protein
LRTHTSGALELANAPKMRPMINHIHLVSRHFRDFVHHVVVMIYPVGTLDQLADIFTKPLSSLHFVNNIGKRSQGSKDPVVAQYGRCSGSGKNRDLGYDHFTRLTSTTLELGVDARLEIIKATVSDRDVMVGAPKDPARLG